MRVQSKLKQLVVKVFSTSHGKDLLEEMAREYDGDDLRGVEDNVTETYYNLGRRAVVRDLQFYLKHGDEE